MADYYTKFSCSLDLKTIENAARAVEIYARNEGLEQETYGFMLDIYDETTIWIRSDGEGDVESVINFVCRCAKEFGLTGRWGFEYSFDCSKPRLDAFGGGAQMIDLATSEVVGWVSTSQWLEQQYGVKEQ